MKNLIDTHIMRAIAQAKKEGNKGVRGFTGGIEEHHKYTKLRNEGKLEIFTQKYKLYDSQEGYCTCILMRKPKK
ncbi:MAG: hypothetical protein ACOC4B_01675 [Bacteroidota bacterium]